MKRKDRRYIENSLIYYDKAIEIADKIFTEEDFQLANAYMQRSIVRQQTNDKEGAYEDIQKAINFEPNNPYINLLFLIHQASNGEYEEAIRIADNLLNKLKKKDLDPIFYDSEYAESKNLPGQILIMRGLANSANGNQKGCIKDMTRSLDFDMQLEKFTNADIYKYIGDCRLKSGDKKGALDYYN